MHSGIINFKKYNATTVELMEEKQLRKRKKIKHA